MPASDLRRPREHPSILAPHGSVPAFVAANVGRPYPTLSGVRVDCTEDQCLLHGTLRPPRSQADLDKRQEMLLGRLVAVLANDGYTLKVPFGTEEIDDNLFVIDARLTPTDGE